MGDVIFLRRREPAGTPHEADPSMARSIDELPPIAPWRRRQFDGQLRTILNAQPKTRLDAEVDFELRQVEDWPGRPGVTGP